MKNILVLCIILLLSVCSLNCEDDSTNQIRKNDEVGGKTEHDRERESGKESSSGQQDKDVDKSELPLYKIVFPGSREQLKKKEWTGNEIDSFERIKKPHRLQVLLPNETTLKSISKYTRLIIFDNGIRSIKIHPLLEGVVHKEVLTRFFERVEEWNIRVAKEDIRRMKNLQHEKPELIPRMGSGRRIIGKLKSDPNISFEFKIDGVVGSKRGWFYAVTIAPRGKLMDEIRGIEEPKYRIKLENVTGKTETKEFTKSYDILVKIRDEEGNIQYSEDPGIAPGGHFHYLWGSTTHIEIPEVPKNGELYIRIKPRKQLEKKGRTFKYLPLEKTIPGEELITGQTIQLELKKNPDYNEK